MNAFYRFRKILVAHFLWLLVVFLMVAWWSYLLWQQAIQILELESQLGFALDLSQQQWHRTQRMLFWESSAFLVLLLLATFFLLFLYWKDFKQTQGLQAFFASVTHEMRTPLTSIRLQAELLSDSIDKSCQYPVFRKLLQRLFEDTLRLETQVERTLELARLEGGGAIVVQPLLLKPWLERCLQTWQLDYAHQIKMTVECQEILVEVDPNALQIVLRNLIENTLRHAECELVELKMQTMISHQECYLILQDNGKGYSGSIKQLGKLFYRHSKSSGTGVGLYLVKTLIQRMGGWVEFSNHHGFQVVLGLKRVIDEHAAV